MAADTILDLRILATTDLHAQIYPFDYYNDRPNNAVGLTRTATLVRQARAEMKNSILLDNGDFLQGNPLADYVAQECGLKRGQTHPVIAAMNALGYDAATLGNHEFDYGVDFLMRALKGSDFPVVSANILSRAGASKEQPLVNRYALIDKTLVDENGTPHQLCIGLIGFAPPRATLWDIKSRNGDIFTRDILETARALIPEMKQKGADVIIALSHSGIHSANETASMENASIDVAEIDGIDAVIAGHTHQVFPCGRRLPQPAVDAQLGLLHNKPAVMAGSMGSHLGVIDLRLRHINTHWSVEHSSVEARPIYALTDNGYATALVANDPDVERAAAKSHANTLDYIHRPIGTSSAALHSYFAQITNEATMAIVTEAQQVFARRALKNGPYDHLPVLSAASPVKVGGRGGPENYIDISAGGLAIRHIADLYYYPDLLCVVKITGADLRQWLERSAGAFNHIPKGSQDRMLLNPDFPCYFFDIIKGVTYRIDLTQPARYDLSASNSSTHASQSTRIIDLRYNGQTVSDDMEFAVATNSYRGAGGGDFCGASRDNIIFEARKTNRDVILDYAAHKAILIPTITPVWTFCPQPSTSVLFDTGVGARNHINDVKGLSLHDTGTTVNGFARFRIDL